VASPLPSSTLTVATKGSGADKSERPHKVRETSRSFHADTLVSSTVYYLESSALLAALLEGDVQVRTLLRSHSSVVTSALTFAECTRGLVRARVLGRLSADDEHAARDALAALQRRCASIPVSDSVLERVGRAFPVEPVRSLDAVHLASLEAIIDLRQSVTVVTRDRRVRDNALQLGFLVA